MSSNFSKANEIRLSIDELTKDIINKLNNYELDSISLLLEKRLELLRKLIQVSDNGEDIQNYMIGLLKRDQDIMRLIHKEQERISSVILNINNLNDYLDASLS